MFEWAGDWTTEQDYFSRIYSNYNRHAGLEDSLIRIYAGTDVLPPRT